MKILVWFFVFLFFCFVNFIFWFVHASNVHSNKKNNKKKKKNGFGVYCLCMFCMFTLVIYFGICFLFFVLAWMMTNSVYVVNLLLLCFVVCIQYMGMQLSDLVLCFSFLFLFEVCLFICFVLLSWNLHRNNKHEEGGEKKKKKEVFVVACMLCIMG